MDNPATVVIAVLLGLSIGVPFMALIMYGAFLFGQRLADRFGSSIKKSFTVPLLCLAWSPLLFVGTVVPGTDYVKGVLGILVYLMNAYPNVIGFVTRRLLIEEQESKRFHKNVDDWLGDWECREEEPDGLLRNREDEDSLE